MLSKAISWLQKENVASRAVQIISRAKVLRCLAGSLHYVIDVITTQIKFDMFVIIIIQ